MVIEVVEFFGRLCQCFGFDGWLCIVQVLDVCEALLKMGFDEEVCGL